MGRELPRWALPVTLTLVILLGIPVLAYGMGWWRPGRPGPEEPGPPGAAGLWEPLQEARFYEKLPGGAVQCGICFRACVIPAGGRGFCRTRVNVDGRLFTLVYGRPSALHIDPVEKEPLHHFLPGSAMLCVGTAGCNFRCAFCHNWPLSQRPPEEMARVYNLPPEAVVAFAREHGLPSISFTYNEPTVAFEYLYDVAALARQHGIRVVFHSNGGMKPEPLRALLRHVDGVVIDLKAFTEEFYREVSQASLDPVLETLKIISEAGVWLEIVNLVVPTLNDCPDAIRAMSEWILANLGPDVPLHFSRFFPNYRLTALPPTPVETLEMAHSIAREAGLRFVSIGNVPGHPNNSTFCPDCGEKVIHRIHFEVVDNRLQDGACPDCGSRLPGIWN
ncbi:MAG TPA: AmmeMemoRadiSam system radical SAM enzyme [Bacillota bacterium]|nr:AmmeMemoRadiSam system radical SAM enzyme [Bacillota bacterium]